MAYFVPHAGYLFQKRAAKHVLEINDQPKTQNPLPCGMKVCMCMNVYLELGINVGP